MLTNADCTVYNAYKQDGKTKYQRTVLKGVFWDNSYLSKTIQGGNSLLDETLIFIPFTVDASRSFVQQKEFARDHNRGWTLQANKLDRIVKGVIDLEIEDSEDIKTLLKEYDDVCTIQKVGTKDYGSANMRHWEVVAV